MDAAAFAPHADRRWRLRPLACRQAISSMRRGIDSCYDVSEFRRLVMRAELLPGMTNVVRFPVERRARPRLELLREMAPDVREMLAMADAIGVEAADPRLRDEADAEMAEWIVNQVPPAGPERAAMLAGCREEALARAISACRAVHDASLQLTDARQAWTAHRPRAATGLRRCASGCRR
jgi:hypothetical protein